MAKRKIRKTKSKKRSLPTLLIALGTVFSVILFAVKVITGSVGWFEIFTPVLLAFFIIFILSVLRTAVRRV